MKKRLFAFLTGTMAITALLSGCVHGETFEEWKNQHFAKNPSEYPVVEPNDSTYDKQNMPYLKSIASSLQSRKNFNRKVRILASQNTTAFLNAPGYGESREERRKALLLFAQTLISGFGKLSDFRIINTEEEALRGAGTADLKTANNDSIYSVVFNVTVLEISRIDVEESYFDPQGHLRKRQVPHYKGVFAASIILIDDKGEQKMTLDASDQLTVPIKSNGHAVRTDCIRRMILRTTEKLFTQYTRKTAPPAYVTKMCGNGLFAQIPIGAKFGIHPGMRVRFFRFLQNTDFVTGQKKIETSNVGYGTVTPYIGSNTAWVKVDLYHYRQVHLGTMVQIQ